MTATGTRVRHKERNGTVMQQGKHDTMSTNQQARSQGQLRILRKTPEQKNAVYRRANEVNRSYNLRQRRGQ